MQKSILLVKIEKKLYTNIGQNMLEFEIYFNISQKIQKNANENKYFFLKINYMYVKSTQ